MQELIDGLKKLTFKHPDFEKRRVQILDAFEHHCSIPSDEADLWVLNKVTKGLLPPDMEKKIDKWYAETMYDVMIENLLKRIDEQYPNERAWFESLTHSQKCVMVLFEYNHKKLH